MNENNRQDCIERARQGEPAAIAELYNRYWRAARAAAQSGKKIELTDFSPLLDLLPIKQNKSQ